MTKAVNESQAAIFVNSFMLSNNEKVYKRAKESDDPDADPRTLKVSKIIGEVVFSYELDKVDEHPDMLFQTVCACSTIVARHLAITRGSEADPEYMENAVREMVLFQDKCSLEVL